MRTSPSSASTRALISAFDRSVWIENISRDLVADGAQRIERRHRLLKDHRDAGAAHLAHFGNGCRAEIAALEHHPAAVDASPHSAAAA